MYKEGLIGTVFFASKLWYLTIRMLERPLIGTSMSLWASLLFHGTCAYQRVQPYPKSTLTH